MKNLKLDSPEKIGLSKEALKTLDAGMQSYIDSGTIYGGQIIVARGGVIGHQKCYGTVGKDRPAVENDLYLLMSLSKSISATLVLRAVDKGLLTLNTQAASLLPNFASGGKQHITVHQLLSHQAGVYNGLIPPPPINPMELGDFEKSYQAAIAQPVQFVPGERVCYSPYAGHAILAKLVEATDPKKRTFSQIAKEDLFEPLGMTSARFGNAINDPMRVEVSHTPKMQNSASEFTAKFLNNLASENSVMPAGNVYATAADVFRFADAMRNGGTNGEYRVLSKALLDYATQNHCGDKTNDAWVSVTLDNGFPLLPAKFTLLGGYNRGEGHFMTGAGYTASSKAFYAVGGGSTMYMVDPERDLTVVFLTAGFIEGLAHFERLCHINDLVLSACVG